MNICLLNDSFPPVIDGVANVVLNYGNVLTEKLDSNVIVGTPEYPGATYEGYPYKVVAYPSFDTTEFVKGYRTGYPLAVREIDQMAKFKPDIIHTHCPAVSTVVARILRKETGVPIVFTYHTKFDVDISRAVGEGFLKEETIKIMIKNIEACDEVWVVSNGAGENLRSLGYSGEYIVMPNGVDFPKGRVSQDIVKEVTKEFDLPENVPVFLFVGRMMKYKGLPLIIDALNLLSKQGVDYRMVFVGGGADSKEMQNKVSEFGIPMDVVCEENVKGDCSISHIEGTDGMTGRVIFTGPEHDRTRLRAWNTRADLFLFPSVYDTNGIVVREAAACGLASVLIEGSCAAEGITHDRNGYMIKESAESMAQLLASCSKDLSHLHEIGQNAMDEIYISWEKAVREAFDRYKILNEMAKNGEFGHRKHQSVEKLMESTSDILNVTEKVFKAPRNLYEGMMEGLEDLREDVAESQERFKTNVDRFKDKFTNELKDRINGNTED